MADEEGVNDRALDTLRKLHRNAEMLVTSFDMMMDNPGMKIGETPIEDVFSGHMNDMRSHVVGDNNWLMKK